MPKKPELVVMLTYDDLTVPNAHAIFDCCRHTQAQYWGFKEKGLPLPEMKDLFAYMKACGKTTALEVVTYTPDEGMAGAETAAACGVDLLMGTVYSDDICAFCKAHGMKYMPFVGEVSQRPSILEGTADAMIAEAQRYLQKGVDGFDLLGYRYTGDAFKLNRAFVSAVRAPVCIAGSVNSFARLEEVKQVAPWSFTVGSAFFDHAFGDSFEAQINTVCDVLNGRAVRT